jgi:EAL domain-containing protein (putative c-di-GMP-specific phosphodiesterase class I)
VLELSERHSQLGGERLAALVPHYVSQGYRVALDDLGAGHASLGALVSLEPHIVKLDGGLVRGVGASHTRWHLVRALVEFAGHTSTQLVAEGIETAEDAAALVHAGVEYGQGYYLGLPRPIEDFRREARPPRPGRLPPPSGPHDRKPQPTAGRSRVGPSHVVTVWPEATNEGTMVN